MNAMTNLNRRAFIGGTIAGAVAAGLPVVAEQYTEYTLSRGLGPTIVEDYDFARQCWLICIHDMQHYVCNEVTEKRMAEIGRETAIDEGREAAKRIWTLNTGYHFA